MTNFSQTKPLFKIIEYGKVGYINNKGETVIKPIYLNGNDFSEGLASVRIGGYFGFIDEKGKIVIPAIYDFANSFTNGLARVYKAGIPIYINKKNKQIICKPYKSLWCINSKRGVVTTYNNRKGIIDLKTEKLLVDTLYSRINIPYKGISVVEKYLEKKSNPNEYYVALIDSVGHYIVPFGKYNYIRDFQDDYTLVKIKNPTNENEAYQGAIDLKGNLLFKRPIQGYDSYIEGNFNNGLARIILYKDWLPKIKGENTYLKQYQGYINVKGEIVLNDTLNKYASNFKNERAYVVGFDRKIRLINTSFEKVNTEPLNYIFLQFDKGYARISTNGKSGIIDKDANYIVKPTFKDIYEFGFDNETYFFTNDTVSGKKLYGIANLNSDIILKPMISSFNNNNGFVNGLVTCTIDGKSSYVNKEGKIIWQEKTDKDYPLEKMNIDYMNNPSYYAIHFDPNTYPNSSNFYKYYSYPKQIINTNSFEKEKLSVYIDTLQNVDYGYREKHLGYKVYVANTTTESIEFNTQDNNISIKLQAQTKNGEWKDIEYLDGSGCGNSYYKTHLDANKYWDFVIPNYDGEIKTKIRAELKYINSETKKENVIYSNLINSGINPAQFWNNHDYLFGLY